MRKILNLILSFIFVCSCKGPSKISDFKTIITSNSTLIIDVRTPEEFQSGHIEKSINIPLNVISDNIEYLKPYKNLILVCRSGRRSGEAKKILEEKGFTNVHNGGSWESFDRTYIR